MPDRRPAAYACEDDARSALLAARAAVARDDAAAAAPPASRCAGIAAAVPAFSSLRAPRGCAGGDGVAWFSLQDGRPGSRRRQTNRGCTASSTSGARTSRPSFAAGRPLPLRSPARSSDRPRGSPPSTPMWRSPPAAPSPLPTADCRERRCSRGRCWLRCGDIGPACWQGGACWPAAHRYPRRPPVLPRWRRWPASGGTSCRSNRGWEGSAREPGPQDTFCYRRTVQAGNLLCRLSASGLAAPARRPPARRRRAFCVRTCP